MSKKRYIGQCFSKNRHIKLTNVSEVEADYIQSTFIRQPLFFIFLDFFELYFCSSIPIKTQNKTAPVLVVQVVVRRLGERGYNTIKQSV